MAEQLKSEKIASLQEMFDYQVQFAAKAFADMSGSVSPMFVGQDAEGILYPITTAWESREEKHQIMMAVQEVFRKFEIVRYVSMVEAWMLIADKDDTAAKKEFMNAVPSEHPKRQEAIIIIGEDGARQLFGFYPIIRDEKGATTLGQFKLQDTGNAISSGTLTELLPKQNQTKH